MLLLLFVALGIASCERESVAVKQVCIPVSICLPTDVDISPAGMPRRVPGDPGKAEKFLLPEYIYIFVVWYDKTEEQWKVWEKLTKTPTEEEWVKQSYVGLLNTIGDSIYRYTEELVFPLVGQDFKGRVYAIASSHELSFNRSITNGSSLEDLLTLTFDASSTTIQQNLQNIYSSPANYNVSGSYYGSFSTRQRVPVVNLMLYHVAAKVDLMWSVAEEKRINKADPSEAVRLTYMEARRLYNGNALCFRPMKNVVASLPVSGYDIPNIVTPADEGLWWEGRTYFYTIPYIVSGAPSYFPLQLLMRTNGSSGTGYQLTLDQPIDTSDVFVPWVRGTLNLTDPLTDTSDTKTIN